MKTSISVFLLVLFSYKAHPQCNLSNSFFNFSNNWTPKVIRNLGSSPQIDFLRQVKSADAFIAILKSNLKNERFKNDINELNSRLIDIGFEMGANDPNFNSSRLSLEKLPFGIKGNLGSNSGRYEYVELELEENQCWAWKIRSTSGCFFYIFLKCGNLFYPNGTPTDECPSCPKVTFEVKEGKFNFANEFETRHQKVVVEVYGFSYINTIVEKTIVSSKHKASSYRQVKKRELVKDSILLKTEILDFPYQYSPLRSAQVTLDAYSNSLVICKDSTVTLPIRLKVAEASSETMQQSTITKKIHIPFGEKAYRELKKNGVSGLMPVPNF